MQPEDGYQSESDSEEPSPEALARYLAMRRHTVGVGDPRHEVPEDARVKLAQHQPIIALPQPNLFMPLGYVPNTNLPQNVPLDQGDTPPNLYINNPNYLLRPPVPIGAQAHLGRRASDGGANIQLFTQHFQRHVYSMGNQLVSQEDLSGVRVTSLLSLTWPCKEHEKETNFFFCHSYMF